MEFEWDSAKARENESKPESRFSKCAKYLTMTILRPFAIPTILWKKIRYLIFGMSKGGKYLVVSYASQLAEEVGSKRQTRPLAALCHMPISLRSRLVLQGWPDAMAFFILKMVG